MEPSDRFRIWVKVIYIHFALEKGMNQHPFTLSHHKCIVTVMSQLLMEKRMNQWTLGQSTLPQLTYYLNQSHVQMWSQGHCAAEYLTIGALWGVTFPHRCNVARLSLLYRYFHDKCPDESLFFSSTISGLHSPCYPNGLESPSFLSYSNSM